MSSKAMSLKAKIKNYAKSNNIAAQVVLQNYMFERFLARLSVSKYHKKFIIKGGMLIAAIVGLDTRATMDLDATLKNIPLTEGKVMEAIKEICSIDLNDDVIFKTGILEPIRKDDQYGGYCIKLNAIYDTIITPLAIDISTGDVITPSPVRYEFSGIFDETVRIGLWGYNIETVMAEKVETILSRGIFSTRPRDYYDIYILGTTQRYDRELFFAALEGTSKHRGSYKNLANVKSIIELIAVNEDLKQMWAKYQRKFAYAKDISYEDTIVALRDLMQC